MDSLIKSGRYIFAVSMIFFGSQHFLYAIAKRGPIASAPWVVGNVFWAWLVGSILILAGVSIAVGRKIVMPAAFLASTLLVYALVLYGPRLVANIHNPQPWTSVTELLAMSGAAFILSGSQRDSRFSASVTHRFIIAGRVLFGIQLAIWGIQHLMYANFVATLVPAWLPWRLFWGLFVGFAFIAADVSFVTSLLTRLAATLLGTLFFVIVATVHIQRVAAEPGSGSQWTSIFVAITMCGAGLMVAQACPSRGHIVSRAIGREPIQAA